jgi:hypothetical protein
MCTAQYNTASSQLCVPTAKEIDDFTRKIETPEPAVAPYMSWLKSATQRPARFVQYSNARHEKYFFSLFYPYYLTYRTLSYITVSTFTVNPLRVR